MIIPPPLPPLVRQILYHYLHLQFDGKSVPCPYFKSHRSVRGDFIFNYHLQGKGSPVEIENLTKQIALKNNFNLSKASIEQIRQFMRRKSIGVDCSGFAYHLLNAFHQTKTRTEITTVLKRPMSLNPLSWLRQIRYRLNVKNLTGSRNSVNVPSLSFYKPGDLIRMQSGHHVLIILESNKKQIIYTHSSQRYTKIKGVHLGKISITKPNQPLENQTWQEQGIDGKNYKNHYHTDAGDGVFRLKAWSKKS
jgi:hypothetical protein